MQACNRPCWSSSNAARLNGVFGGIWVLWVAILGGLDMASLMPTLYETANHEFEKEVWFVGTCKDKEVRAVLCCVRCALSLAQRIEHFHCSCTILSRSHHTVDYTREAAGARTCGWIRDPDR
jgi:hypothetical protein